MAANGTPQSYLASQRPNISTMRDMSMDQNYTITGNPQGYVPPQFARYTPPMESNPNGTWNQGGLQYSLPTSYGSYASSTPPLPKFNPQSIYNAFANAGRQNQFGGGGPAAGGVGQQFNYMPQMAGNRRFQRPMGQGPGGVTAQPVANGPTPQLNPGAPLPQFQQGGLGAAPANTNVSDMMKQFQLQLAQQQAAQQSANQLPPSAVLPNFNNGGLSQGSPNFNSLIRQY